MAKLLSFSDESRSALERGVDALADAVRVTIGPRGRNVVLEKKFGAPDIVNDGDSIAREIELDDPFENLGAKLMQQVSSKTKDKALSLVFEDTCCISLAPRFSNGSSSSISRAIESPSLTMSGAPNFFSSTTLRPRGPIVTRTASASASTPRSRALRDSSEKERSLAIVAGTPLVTVPQRCGPRGEALWWGKPNGWGLPGCRCQMN